MVASGNLEKAFRWFVGKSWKLKYQSSRLKRSSKLQVPTGPAIFLLSERISLLEALLLGFLLSLELWI